MIPPIVKLPVSPMNTCAGKALYQRKPIRAPMKAHMKITSSFQCQVFPEYRLLRTTAEISKHLMINNSLAFTV